MYTVAGIVNMTADQRISASSRVGFDSKLYFSIYFNFEYGVEPVDRKL